MSVELVRYDAACQAISEARSVDEAKDILDMSVAMRAYARQAKNKELEADAWEIRSRAERRISELVELQRESVGLAKGGASQLRAGPDGTRSFRCLNCRQLYKDPPGHICEDAPATLADAGIDKHLADRARKIGRLEPAEFEQRLQEGRARILEVSERVRVDVLSTGAHVGQNSGDNEWFTPAEFIEPARKVLGSIDLDPASSAEANKVVKAKRFFTKEDDGLSEKWEGRLWMNPPYAQPLIDQFSEKLAASYTDKSVSEAIALVNNATETAWFNKLADVASAVCFPKGRVRFWHSEKPSATPLQGQALLYLGSKPKTFHARFSEIGTVWVKP